MSYTILNTDGTTLLLLADGTVDQVTTSLSLVGKNVNGYGEYLNNNIITLLANSANTSGNPPRNPLKGQLWYDTTAQRLKIYDNGFKSISGALVSDTTPTASTGDLWFDTTNNQLKVFVNNVLYTVGPAIPKGIGATGWYLPTTAIKDSNLNAQQVGLLRNYGTTLGLMSNTAFTMDATDAFNYLGAVTTTTVVKGLTVVGDIQFSGQITNKNLSMAVNIDVLPSVTGSSNDASGTWTNIVNGNITTQNNDIKSLLTLMYPPATSTAKSDLGFPIGSEARVICQFSKLDSASTSGYQIRRFHVDINPFNTTQKIWRDKSVYYWANQTTATNIVN
jgi:hypothetical protein